VSVDRQRVEEVFIAALDLATASREAFVRRACGDDHAVREEVLSLLAHHDDRDLLTTEPAEPDPPSTAPTQLDPPTDGDGSLPSPPRYERLGLLGEGGCGHVMRTYDRYLRRVVAAKLLNRDDPRHRALLLQEARLLAWLDHPGAVPVYDVGTDEGGVPYYTMRELHGETLRQRIDRGPLTIREVIRTMARISETMQNAHAKGVLHLDLKPANIMLLPYGQVCILDWGVAQFHDLAAYRAFLRQAGDPEPVAAAGYEGIAGTPSYMPVEQATGEALTPAADVFACGTLLYEMLVRRLPYPSQSPLQVLVAKSRVVPDTPSTLRGDIPARLEALCMKMIASDAADRPASFAEVSAELDGLTHGGDHGRERLLADGEVLFREGEPGTEAYQILEGALSIEVDGAAGPTELARRGVGDLVGEMAVVSAAPRSATAVARGPTRVAVVTGTVIEEELASANPLLARMLRSLSARLREAADRVKG